MRDIGKGRHMGRLEYREWPVFKDFRNSYEFADAYREVFEEEFMLVEQEPHKEPTEQKSAEPERE